MIKSRLFSQDQLNSKPYLCDFLLLEIIDSIWVNEVYKVHAFKLTEIAKAEITAVHTLDRFEELTSKKETFRKVLNLIHQMEFNLEDDHNFL